MSVIDPHYWQRWSVVVLGVLTGAAAVIHALVDQNSLLGYVQELALPVLLSLSLVLLGTRLARSNLDTELFPQILTWVVIGITAFGFLGSWLFVHRVLEEGLALNEGVHELTTSLASGALAGSVVGVYDARRQRYQAELELADTVIESTIDGIAVLDGDNRYVSVNQSYVEIYGDDTAAHFVGEQWRYLTSEENRDRFEEDIRPALRETGAWSGEAVVRRTDGGTVPGDLSITELEDGGRVIVVRDITERKAREWELRHRSTAMSASMDGMAILNENGEYSYVNEAHADVYGYDDPDAFLGETWQLCYTDEEVARFEEQVMPALWADGQWRGEAMGKRQDGSLFPQELTLTVLENGGLVCVVRDITERREQEANLSALHGVTREFIAATTAEELTTQMVSAADDMLGYPLTVVWEYDADTDRLVPLTATEPARRFVAQAGVDALPSLESASAEMEIFRGGEPALIEDYETLDDRQVTEVPLGAVLFVPLGDHGLVAIGSPEPEAIDATDRLLCEVLVSNATAAIDRLEREQEIERSEALLDQTQRMADVGGWEYDVRTGEVQWSDEVYRIYDLPLDAELGLEEVLGFFHPEDVPALEDAIERAVEHGESYDLELRLRTANDESRWVRAHGEPHQENGETALLRGAVQDITERKERERELDTTNTTLSTLLKNIPAGILAEDRSRNVLFANQRLCETLSISATPEQLVGANYADVANDLKDLFVDAERFTESNDTLVAEREIVTHEEFELVDGRTLERSGTPIDVPGEGHRYLWVYHDVTEQKTHERTLASLHAGTREMMAAETPEEVADIAVKAARDALERPITTLWLHDGNDALEPAASTEEVDALIEELPTYRAGNSLSWQAFAEEELLVCEDVTALSAAHNPDTEIRSELIVPFGEYGVLNSGSTVRTEFSDADITAVRILAANTEAALERAEREELLHEREAELERERDRFLSLFENVPDPGVIVEFADDEPTIQAVNPAFETVFGYAAEVAVDESLNDLIVPSDQLEEARSVDEKAMQNEQVTKEVRRRTADGGLRDFLFRNVFIESNAEGRAFGIYTDITEQKRRERELERQNEQLEQFASLISHDLRNPLTVATGYLELFDADEGEGEYIKKIENAHDRMGRIIADVLALARQGKTVGETSPVELADVAETAWAHVENADARLAVEDGLGTVRADRSRLESLFENLFRNAVEHGAEDVTCRVGPIPDGFYVEDDGPGIPADERNEVFEYGHTTSDSGTGLGLSIVSTIAEAHGWTASLTEADTGGARFEFSLHSLSHSGRLYATSAES